MPFSFHATIYVVGFAMTAELALAAGAGPAQTSTPGSTGARAQAVDPQIRADAGPPPARAPVRFRCDGDPPLAFTITYYDTDPGTLVAERRGRKIVMVQQPMASGVRYTADGASFAEHQGIATITWPGQPRPLRCVR